MKTRLTAINITTFALNLEPRFRYSIRQERGFLFRLHPRSCAVKGVAITAAEIETLVDATNAAVGGAARLGGAATS